MSTTRSNIRVIPLAGKFENVIFGRPKQIKLTKFYLQSIWDIKTKSGYICTLETDEDGRFYAPDKKDIKQVIGPPCVVDILAMVSFEL